MDLRTKLIFALVVVALTSMGLLGTFAYQSAAELLEDLSLRHLDALAESKKDNLREVLEGWNDSVKLIRSRTQLRLSLDTFVETRREQSLQRIIRILTDARRADAGVRRIAVFGPEGGFVASTGAAHVPAPTTLVVRGDEVSYQRTVPRPDGLDIVYHARLRLEGELIGHMEAVLDGIELESVAADRTGLGKTGETLIFMRDEERPERVVPLNLPRHATSAEMTSSGSSRRHIEAALAGEERIFRSGIVDYRGAPLRAATRYLPEAGWGLVVKIDEAEEREPIVALRGMLLDLGLALSAFAIVGGTLLGLYLAAPIRKLVEIVDRIRHGETHLRADEHTHDEIGFLASALNEFMDEVFGREAQRHDSAASDDRDA